MLSGKAALSLFALPFLSACASAPGGMSEVAPAPVELEQAGPLRSIVENGAVNPHSLGAWVSRGYGYILNITDDGLTRYHDDGSYCFATPEAAKGATDSLSLEYRYFRTSPDGQWAAFQLLPDDTQIVFDRLSSLPERCFSVTPNDYTTNFDIFARLIGDHYAFFKERKIDWPARVAAARPKLAQIGNDKEFFDLLASMIDGFSDSHTKLIAVIEGQKRRQQDGQGQTLPMVRNGIGETPWLIGIFGNLAEKTLSPSYHVANDRIIWGKIGDNVGYIQIFVMGGFTGTDIADPGFRDAELAALDSIMQEAFTAFSNADAIILDLSNNRGGYDAISRRLAGYFSDEPYVAYTTQARGAGQPPVHRMASAPDDIKFTGPVYLMTSDVTVSGGELAVLAMKQLPNVSLAGGATRGSFSTVFSKPLPNGWVIEMSNEVIAGADGAVYEETGIAPDLILDVYPSGDPIGGHAKAIHAVVDLINQTE